MMRLVVWLAVFLLRLAWAEIHTVLVANRLSPANIHHLEFDDETARLKLVKSMPADSGHIWIAFSPDKKTIYGVSKEAYSISSYTVGANGTVALSSVVRASGACERKTPAFAIASNTEPSFVFASAYPGPNGCGMSISVKDDGLVKEVADSWAYGSNSGVHGLALADHDGQLVLYAADLGGNSIWASNIDKAGKAGAGRRYQFSETEMHPRHMTTHPNGTYLYAIMEAGTSFKALRVGEMEVDIAAAGNEYMLVPEGSLSDPKADYTAADIMLSPSGRYLWATSRARGDGSITGYIACFLLDDAGAVLKEMLMVPTASFGSISNAITTAPWSDEYVLLTDVPGGYVEVWKMDGKEETELGVEYTVAKPIARVDIGRSCCANALWVN